MLKLKLDKMSYRDLLQLSQQLAREIESRKKSEKGKVKRELIALVENAGFELDDIVGAKKGAARKRRKVAPKYRNPRNPDETWTGRGRQPKWLVAELAKGRKLGSFLIK